MALSFYLDTHIAKAIADQLRVQGVGVVRCEDVGLAEADDEAHLEFSARSGRVLVTQDADFAQLHRRWQAEGRHHAGIVRIPAQLQGAA